MEGRRLPKRVRGMQVESSPRWLPDGWTVEVRNTRHGEYRYYRSLVSGCTFPSKEEVLRHLSVIKHDDETSRGTSCSNESKVQLAEEMKEPLEWLPSGWIVEIKTRRSGKYAGKTYKCYFEPLSGDRFYSKVEVIHFLSRKVHEQTSDDKKHLNKNSTNNVIANIEYSPDVSPHGWIKETKFIEGNGGLGKNLSSASSKKLRSQPAGKKHRLAEEILVINEDLSEAATVPDRLLLPPSTREIVELKAKESAQESTTLSPPCLINPRERTPKNGRIPKRKCGRKSIISNERTNMESEENIKSEEVTEKPSDPSNQTMMDFHSDGKELATHTEEDANQGGESNPESVTNSKDNSKDEDRLTMQVENVTVMFPLASIKTSKDLLGDEMELIVANQKASTEKGEFLNPQNKNLSEMEKEFPIVVGNPSTPDLVKPKHGSRKPKAMITISRPQRLSRRLACVEANLATDVDMGGERPRESKSNNTSMEEASQRQKNIEAVAVRATESLQRKNTMEDKATASNQAPMNWPEFSSTLAFGDSWLDPCLEFAFKTLTGDLPALDDTVAIQEYFQQQLFSLADSTSPDVLAPVSNNKTEAARTSDKVNIKQTTEQDMQERSTMYAGEKS